MLVLSFSFERRFSGAENHQKQFGFQALMRFADRPSDDSVLAIEIRYVRSEPRDIVCPNQALLREMTDWTQSAMDCVRQVRRFDTGLATISPERSLVGLGSHAASR